MRVLMLTSEWPAPGGTPRTTHFIRRQVEYLRAAGVDVDLFHFPAGRRPGNYLRAWVRAHGRMARERYDLVHAQWGQSALPALPTRLPLVVTLRGDDIGGIVGEDLRVTPAGRLLRFLTRCVTRVADHVILVSAHMRDTLHPSVPTTVIPSGLDLEHFRPVPRDEARRQLNLSSDERLILFVGRPATPRKRYALAQAAVAELSRRMPARLLVAWGVRHDDIHLYYNAADALLFTSMQEGSPNAVKEALACDCPVVSVPVGDTPRRLAGVAGCELCTEASPEALARALERVLARGARSAGRQAVADLDERRTTQQVIAVYRSVLGAPERRPVPATRDALA